MCYRLSCDVSIHLLHHFHDPDVDRPVIGECFCDVIRKGHTWHSSPSLKSGLYTDKKFLSFNMVAATKSFCILTIQNLKVFIVLVPEIWLSRHNTDINSW